MICDVMVEWLTLLLRNREVPVSNLNPEIGYPELTFCGFPQSLKANYGIVPSN
jgi:hypothetical protein